MKRLHIHVGVGSLDQSIRFYSALFGAQPTKTQPDYAKWMLDDPFVNFAISTRSGKWGVDHLGLQVEDDAELEQIRERLKTADMSVYDEGEATCCYARSDKTWVQDPAGVAWESFKTMEDLQTFSKEESPERAACCSPVSKGQLDTNVSADANTGSCC